MTSTSITAPGAASLVKRPNSVAVGTIVWLGSEVMFFAGLFAIYFTLRSTTGDLFAFESSKLNIPFSTVNTIILVLSSVSCQAGVFAAERLQPRRTAGALNFMKWGMVEWYYLTYALGAIFIVGQVYEYAVLVSEGITLASSAYGSAFYITTGFHGLHVTGGLIAFLYVIGRAYAVRNFGHKEATTAIVVSYYWHFVDAVWIALFLVVYVVR